MQEEIAVVAQVNGNGNADGPKPAEPTSTSAIVTEEETTAAVNGTQPATATTTTETNGTNGDATPKKAKKEKKEKKEKVVEPKEPPKSLQEDPADWAKHHAGIAKRKANHDLLSKITTLVEEDESKRAPLPGKPDSVSGHQLVQAFADGQLASQLVKKLSIIAAVPTVEGEEELKKKENQIALLQAFADFAKTEGGVPEEKLPVLAEVQEGKKQAYPALFTTLVTALGNKGQVCAETLAADAEKYAEENCLSGKTIRQIRQISHSISNLKLSLNRKKSTGGEAAHENGVAEKTNGEANGVTSEEKVNGENGNGETSHAPNGSVAVEEVKIEESRAVAAN